MASTRARIQPNRHRNVEKTEAAREMRTMPNGQRTEAEEKLHRSRVQTQTRCIARRSWTKPGGRFSLRWSILGALTHLHIPSDCSDILTGEMLEILPFLTSRPDPIITAAWKSQNYSHFAKFVCRFILTTRALYFRFTICICANFGSMTLCLCYPPLFDPIMQIVLRNYCSI